MSKVVNLNLDDKYLKRKDYVTFSMAKFATSAVVGLTQGYLLIFYTSVLGINPLQVGLMFLIAKIFDGFNDPIMGVIIDKTHTKWGKMRPYIMFGAIPFGVITILLFIPIGSLDSAGKIAYMYITYLSYGIIGTIINVPMDGLPAVASPNNEERTKIISVSRIVGSIAEEAALVLYSFFMLFFNMRDTYMTMGLIIGITSPVFVLLGVINVKERIPPSKVPPKMLDGFKYLFRNKQFASLILSLFLTFIRNIATAAVIYVVTYIYLKGSLQIFFALPGAIASLVGMLIAPKLRKKFDNKVLFTASITLNSIGLLLLYFIGMDVPWYVIAAILPIAMFPVGTINVVPHFMAIDTLDYWEDKTGQRNEGVTFALISLRSKVSSAFKDFVLASLLAFFFFTTPLQSIHNHTPTQLNFTKSGIFMIFTLIPGALNFVCLIPLMFYKLSRKRMDEIRARLAIKRAVEFGNSDQNKANIDSSSSVAISGDENCVEEIVLFKVDNKQFHLEDDNPNEETDN
ncbi:MAG: glycoside-pentoside-hexuronide (GPH):cation symporter [Christensenellaceae bacterium]|jgi:sugar (glycoside-pentoside-hexuronide) transporter|nr:glycoside-pentoside-hexuronide (GPH):cation symporter [Christensenellaceae bacterium]